MDCMDRQGRQVAICWWWIEVGIKNKYNEETEYLEMFGYPGGGRCKNLA